MDKTPSRVKITIAIISAIAVIAAAIIGSPFLTNKNGEQESQIAVRVANANGEAVPRANVLLFFSGGPLSNYTDVNGTTSFQVRFSENTKARLVVETNQFELYEREVQLPRDNNIEVHLNERPVDTSGVIVRVVDNENSLPLVGATVLLLVEGNVFDVSTDSNGIAKFTVDFPDNRIDAQMSIITQEYEVQYQNVTLLPNKVQDIRLDPTSGIIKVAPVSESTLPQSTPQDNTSEDASSGQEVNETLSSIPLGWPYEQAGIQLNLVKAVIRTDADSGSAAARLWFALLNKSSQKILVEFDQDQIYIVDFDETRYVDNDGAGVESFWLESGQVKIIDSYYTLVPGEKSRIPPTSFPITVHVDNFSRVQNAQWMVGGSPLSTYPENNNPGSLNTSFKFNDFEVTMTDLEIRTTSDSSSAAFRAWFSVKNISPTDRNLLEVDFANIYVEDSYGNRYIDYSAAGLLSTWVDPGKEYVFDRYYSLEYETKSRIPVGTSYVVVIGNGIGSIESAEWLVDITR